MEKKWFVGAVVVLLFVFIFYGEDVVEEDVVVDIPVPSIPVPVVIDFQKYNVDYMNDNVKAVLVGQLGNNVRTAFYLPSTGYVNVSRGTKFGVAFVIQNVNPKVPEGNRFDFNWTASSEDCGVGLDVVQSWIERGWTSYGMIGGQWREDWNEWHDAMTVYFAFPVDAGECSVAYDFVITKDGASYDSRSLVFNLI